MRGRQMARVLAAATLLAGSATGCGHHERPEARCAPQTTTARLPGWARGGFSEPDGWLHTTGRRGRILGVLFGSPYAVPARAGRHNKVLWVARRGSARTLTIRATRAGSTQTVVRHVPLGPSTVDLPAPGCWRMDLTWGDAAHRQHDRVDLRYHARGEAS